MGKANREVLTDDEDGILDGEHEDHEDDDDQGHEDDGKPGKEAKGNDKDDEDARLKEGDDDDEGAGETEEQVLERRRKERKERKERREAAMRRDKLELKFLREQNEKLEQRMSQTELATHQSRIAQLNQQLQKTAEDVKRAEQVLAAAMKANNGEDTVKAMGLRDQAMGRLRQLAAAREQLTQSAQRGQHDTGDSQGRQQGQLSPRAQAMAKQFIADHKWYDPRGGDEDSAIVLAVDSTLVREGYDPDSEEYWTELRSRVKRRLPERYSNDQGGRRDDRGEQRGARDSQRGPQLGSGRSAGGGGRKEVYISPERKAALIEAGVWDDPKLRARYVKKYQEYDKLHKQS